MKKLLNKKVLVRTYSAGVHFGELESFEHTLAGTIVELKNVKRIYSWSGAFTLNELAAQGSTTKTSKISMAVPSIFITSIEVIEMTDKGYNNLNDLKTFVA